MGPGGPREHLLLILPVEEPKEQLDRIRKNYPYIDVTYHQMLHGSTRWDPAKHAAPGKPNPVSSLLFIELFQRIGF